MKLPNYYNTTVLLVLISLTVGVAVYLGTGGVMSIFKPAVSTSLSSANKSIPIPPTAINIPKINKLLPVKPASVSGNDWELFDDAVAWLSTSAVPGEGNVILYAHDWTNLWADLHLLTLGDTIEVRQNDFLTTYIVTESRAVNQNDTQSVLSNENRLTLYTCEGTFDQKRRVVYAEPI